MKVIQGFLGHIMKSYAENFRMSYHRNDCIGSISYQIYLKRATGLSTGNLIFYARKSKTRRKPRTTRTVSEKARLVSIQHISSTSFESRISRSLVGSYGTYDTSGNRNLTIGKFLSDIYTG